MDKIESFILKIIDSEEYITDINKYISFKGVERYELVYNELCKSKIAPTWKNLSDLYKYDKRILYVLQRYLAFYEEYLRAILCNKFTICDIDVSNVERKVKSVMMVDKNGLSTIIKIVKKYKSTTFFDILENSTLSLPVAILQNNIDIFDNQNISRFASKTNELAHFKELRNAVAHNRFLIGHNYKGKSLKECISIFSAILPIEYSSESGGHKGFLQEIKSCRITGWSKELDVFLI